MTGNMVLKRAIARPFQWRFAAILTGVFRGESGLDLAKEEISHRFT